MPISPLYLPYISRISRLDLHISRLDLPISPPYLARRVDFRSEREERWYDLRS